MNPLTGINHLPWKYVIGMNLTVLALAITFVSTNSVKQTTENRSQAKEVLPTPLSQIAIDANNPPQLIEPDISWGKVGDAVVVKGKNLGTTPFGILKIGDNTILANMIVEWTPTYIVFTIPPESETGLITLTTKTTTSQELTLSTKNVLTITNTNK